MDALVAELLAHPGEVRVAGLRERLAQVQGPVARPEPAATRAVVDAVRRDDALREARDGHHDLEDRAGLVGGGHAAQRVDQRDDAPGVRVHRHHRPGRALEPAATGFAHFEVPRGGGGRHHEGGQGGEAGSCRRTAAPPGRGRRRIGHRFGRGSDQEREADEHHAAGPDHARKGSTNGRARGRA